MKFGVLHSLLNVEQKYMLQCCKQSSLEKVEFTEIFPKIQTVKGTSNTTIALGRRRKKYCQTSKI